MSFQSIPLELFITVWKNLDLDSALCLMQTCNSMLGFLDSDWQRVFKLKKYHAIHGYTECWTLKSSGNVKPEITWQQAAVYSFSMFPLAFTKRIINWFETGLTDDFWITAVSSDKRENVNFLLGREHFPKSFSSPEMLWEILINDSRELFQEYLLENIKDPDNWFNSEYHGFDNVALFLLYENSFKIFKWITDNAFKINNWRDFTSSCIHHDAQHYLKCWLDYYELTREEFSDVLNEAFDEDSVNCISTMVCSQYFNDFNKLEILQRSVEYGYLNVIDIITTHEIIIPEHGYDLLLSLDIAWYIAHEDPEWQLIIEYLARIPNIIKCITEHVSEIVKLELYKHV